MLSIVCRLRKPPLSICSCKNNMFAGHLKAWLIIGPNSLLVTNCNLFIVFTQSMEHPSETIRVEFLGNAKIRLELASVLVQVDTFKTNTDIKNSTSFKSFSNGKPGKLPTDFRLHFGRHLTQEEACQRCGPTAEMGPTKSTRKDRLTSFSPPLSDRMFS